MRVVIPIITLFLLASMLGYVQANEVHKNGFGGITPLNTTGLTVFSDDFKRSFVYESDSLVLASEFSILEADGDIRDFSLFDNDLTLQNTTSTAPGFISSTFITALETETEDAQFFYDESMSVPIYWPSQIYPHAIYYNDRTYFTWQGEDLDPFIIYYNHTSDTWADPVEVGDNPLNPVNEDYHGAPALLITDDGFIHVFFGGHGFAPGNNLKHAKSDSAEDISSWTLQSDAASAPTYPQLIKNNTGAVYLAYRRTIAVDRQPLAYRVSTDNASTWGSSTDIIDFGTGWVTYPFNWELEGTDQFHFGFRMVDTAISRSPRSYHAILNTSDSRLYSITGTDLGTQINETEADNNLIIMDTYYSSHATLHLDSSNTPYLIEAIQTGATEGWNQTFIHWNGTGWENETIVSNGDADDGVLGTADFIVSSASPFQGISEGNPTGGSFVSSTGLLLSYDMETLISGDMRDFSGNGNDGTIAGASDIAGLYGQARDFEAGESDHINVTEDDSLDGKRTIAFWFRPEGGWSSAETTHQHIYNHRTDSGNFDGAWVFLSEIDGSLHVVADPGVPSTVEAVSSITDWAETWYHITAIADGSNILLYINGTLDDTGGALATAFPDVMDSNPLRLGTHRIATSLFYDGILDELLIFNRTLSDNEISFLAGSTPTNIEAYITTDGNDGFGGDIERWSWDSETWTQEQVLFTETASGVPLISPTVPLNHSSELTVFFTQVDRLDYTNNDLRTYAHDGTNFVLGEIQVGGQWAEASHSESLDMENTDVSMVWWGQTQSVKTQYVSGKGCSSGSYVYGIQLESNNTISAIVSDNACSLDLIQTNLPVGGLQTSRTYGVGVVLEDNTWGADVHFWLDGVWIYNETSTERVGDSGSVYYVGRSQDSDSSDFCDCIHDELLVFEERLDNNTMRLLTTQEHDIVIKSGPSTTPQGFGGLFFALPWVIVFGLLGWVFYAIVVSLKDTLTR